MHAQEPLPKQAAVPKPPLSGSSALMDPRRHLQEVLDLRAPLRNGDSDGSHDDAEHALPTPPPSSGLRSRRKFSDAARLVIRDAHPAPTRSPLEHSHASPLPTQPPSFGPRALRRLSLVARDALALSRSTSEASAAARPVVRDAQSALRRSISEPAPARPPTRIRITWQPPSNETWKKAFLNENAPSVPSLVFAAGADGGGGRYWNPNSL
ncbi:hypothetical protein T484DRAFT_1849352 [Baffinella frigidus]|nr:hypothetical protein T484DRAFT_1849352 [Cryptophyta sp. CCMP2293]